MSDRVAAAQAALNGGRRDEAIEHLGVGGVRVQAAEHGGL